eukprot:m.655503 g.655503  ORF g.655503 m.655503 type:complete len:577 (+) comp58421_c0_seq4:708-2438(+)
MDTQGMILVSLGHLVSGHLVSGLLDGRKPLISVQEDLNSFIIIFECPLLREEGSFESILVPLFTVLESLSDDDKAILAPWWSAFDADHFRELIGKAQQFITLRILLGSDADRSYRPNNDMNVRNALGYLRILLRASRVVHPPLAPYTEFYNDAINGGIDAKEEFQLWKVQKNSRSFSFCNWSFVIQPAVKVELLGVENHTIKMQSIMSLELFQVLLRGGQPNPFLVLQVRRVSLMRDTLMHVNRVLMDDPREFKKLLRIEFGDEEGLDAGGLSKEFFQIVIRELFDPKYGMFVLNETKHSFWFNSHPMESPNEYKLLGIILGLVSYNGVILDLHFPAVVYRKLLGESVGLEDLVSVDEELYQGLHALLQFPGDDIEAVFDRTFVFEEEVFGAKVCHDLVEGGASKRLTGDNRAEYVHAYANFFLNTSIREQFAAFKAGFDSVCADSGALRLFSPVELDLAICGTSTFDFHALRRVTTYDGFSPTDPVISWFWDVVIAFDEESKKKLLFFATGSDRVPVGGIEKIKFVIVKQGADCNRLPTAHTCFNTLVLPQYSSKLKLETLLRKALLHVEGFGMR